MIDEKNLKCIESKSTVYELFGIPGSGKTFLANRLIKALDPQVKFGATSMKVGLEPRVLRVFKKILLVLLGVVTRPAIVIQLYHILRLYPQTGPFSMAKVAFNWLYIAGAIVRDDRSSSIVVLDQGLAQACWATAFSGKRWPNPRSTARVLRRLVRCLSLDHLFIVSVETTNRIPPWAVCLYGKRGSTSPLDRKPIGNLSLAIETTKHIRSVVDIAANQSAHISVLPIHNMGSGLTSPCIKDLISSCSH
ncbi:hypothetical protein SAMN05920897_1075 [Alkalispirochaeta americana]|uniref:Uncharacterized protein n=1 Tax=Alkalispirochaeta americana TaxID=159291 RepID=A0A1N6RSQ3_9SPIO|nr:hypothetical protein SAMN05920897_1075 [Alkalispirochaeta americana]